MTAKLQPLLMRSPLDSARFGLEIWRGHVRGSQLSGLWQEISLSQPDVAIFRTPAEDIRAMSQFQGPRGLLIHADTLVYYSRDLGGTAIPPVTRNPQLYREGNENDAPELRDVTARVFSDYQNHYHANPLFPPSLILAGYEEWAANHLRPGGATRTWVATHEDSIIGFICCSFDREAGTAEIVLNGVLREHAGKGIYGDLVRIAQANFAKMGMRAISVSTQVGNYAVQRVWSREGMRLSHAFDTWHINAMLSHGRA